MSDKVYECLKDIILPIMSIVVSGFIAFSAYTVSKEAQKVNGNSGILRYEIKAVMKDGNLEITTKPTAGFIRKVVFVNFSDDVVNSIDISDATYTETKSEGKITAISTISSSLMTKKDSTQYIFYIVEGGNGARYLNMVVSEGGKQPVVYDELQTLENSKRLEFNDFRNLRKKLLQEKFIVG